MKITPELLKELGFVLVTEYPRSDYYHLPRTQQRFEFYPWWNNDDLWVFQHGQETTTMKDFDIVEILNFVHRNAYNRGEADAKSAMRRALGIEE